jgi:transposase
MDSTTLAPRCRSPLPARLWPYTLALRHKRASARLDEVAPKELSASGRKGGKKLMSSRPSSIATTAPRKARASAAVTPAAPSGSSGRPAGNGRASRRTGTQLAAAKETARTSRKRGQQSTNVPVPTRKPRALRAAASPAKRAKVADLPPKGVTTSEAPTRSKAHTYRGAKEGTAVKNLRPLDSVPQVVKMLTIRVPPSVIGGHQPPSDGVIPSSPKAASRKSSGRTKPPCVVGQVPAVVALVDVPVEQPAGAQRPVLASPIAVAAVTPKAELLGPITRYVGLDIGKATEFCEVMQEQVTARATVRKETELEALLAPGTGRARVVFEACREAWYLHDLLTGWGHEVWVVDTTRVRQIGIGQHKRKNDRIDAEKLARAGESGRVPRAHVLSHASQRLRLQLGVRRALVETRAQYVGTIRSMLRSEGLQVPGCDVEAFLGKLKSVTLPPTVRQVIEPLVVALKAIGPQIDNVDEQLEQLCGEQLVMELLSSAPGVGRIVSAAFVSVIDNPGRFRNAHQVEAYLGLVPSESTSGKRKLGAITKQGNAYLRTMLVQASWNVLRQRASDPLKSWGLALAKRRGKRVAVVAIARRLAGILWAMWRDSNAYAAAKVGQSSARGKRQEAKRAEVAAATIEAAAVAAP